ncbi:MAG: proton-conducting transporter membrane subunit, partial [Anaerolineae bacterium]|nr:proton-conducting transporter membrane subunit [Anaerolineae bacterium]
IAQTNIKRLLAYSSISHAGFMLMAVTAYGDDAVHFDAAASIIFYLLAFAITSFGAWAVVISLEGKEDRGLALADYAGLARKNPIMAAAMAAFMFSFTGIPPTIGFAGKLYIFRAVIEAGFVGLAVIGVLTSLVSAYYYLRVIVIMYMQDGKPAVHKEPLLQFVTAAAGISVLGLIFLAEPLFSWAANSVLRLF